MNTVIFTKRRLRWTILGVLLAVASIPLQFINPRLAVIAFACSNLVAWYSLATVYNKLIEDEEICQTKTQS